MACHIAGREVRPADQKYLKRFGNKNNFRAKTRQASMPENEVKGSLDMSIEEKFDRHQNVKKLTSNEIKDHLNPLFMNTKAFDQTTKDYESYKK